MPVSSHRYKRQEQNFIWPILLVLTGIDTIAGENLKTKHVQCLADFLIKFLADLKSSPEQVGYQRVLNV